jgi:hypothetical protein
LLLELSPDPEDELLLELELEDFLPFLGGLAISPSSRVCLIDTDPSGLS